MINHFQNTSEFHLQRALVLCVDDWSGPDALGDSLPGTS